MKSMESFMKTEKISIIAMLLAVLYSICLIWQAAG